MKFLKAFGAFWYDFVIGDDWKIAAYTVAALALVAGLAISDVMPDGVVAAIGTVVLAACFILSVAYDARATDPSATTQRSS
jgi:hypothetical protein